MHLIYVVYGPIMLQQFAIHACPISLTTMIGQLIFDKLTSQSAAGLDSPLIVSVLFYSKNCKRPWFQLLNFEELVLFFVLFNRNLNVEILDCLIGQNELSDDDDEMYVFSPKMNILRLSPVSTVNFLMLLYVDYD